MLSRCGCLFNKHTPYGKIDDSLRKAMLDTLDSRSTAVYSLRVDSHRRVSPHSIRRRQRCQAVVRGSGAGWARAHFIVSITCESRLADEGRGRPGFFVSTASCPNEASALIPPVVRKASLRLCVPNFECSAKREAPAATLVANPQAPSRASPAERSTARLPCSLTVLPLQVSPRASPSPAHTSTTDSGHARVSQVDAGEGARC